MEENKVLSWTTIEGFCARHLYTIIVTAVIGGQIIECLVTAKTQKELADEAKKYTKQLLMIQAIKD